MYIATNVWSWNWMMWMLCFFNFFRVFLLMLELILGWVVLNVEWNERWKILKYSSLLSFSSLFFYSLSSYHLFPSLSYFCCFVSASSLYSLLYIYSHLFPSTSMNWIASGVVNFLWCSWCHYIRNWCVMCKLQEVVKV